jgi:hypothetical protein
MASVVFGKCSTVLCFIIMLYARAQDATFEDALATKPSSASLANASSDNIEARAHDGHEDKWAQFERSTRIALEQAADTEALIENETAAMAWIENETARENSLLEVAVHARDEALAKAKQQELVLAKAKQQELVQAKAKQQELAQALEKAQQQELVLERRQAIKAQLAAKEAQLAAAKAEQSQMQTQMIDGMKQAVSVMHVSISQEALQANAAKVRLGCAFGCSGHGTCDRVARRCACHEGWLGEMCDQPRCQDNCNGNGLCVSSMCKCHDGWMGGTCERARCPGDCSGNGYCFAGECMCNALWSGADCLTAVRAPAPADLRVLFRRSMARRDGMSPASPREQPSAPKSATEANARATAPAVAKDAMDETGLEDILPDVDASGKPLPWQHARVQAMHGVARKSSADRPIESKVVKTNTTSFHGAPLTAAWIASA